MVCPDCKAQHHEDCPGGTWCDCQHLEGMINRRLLSEESAKRAATPAALVSRAQEGSAPGPEVPAVDVQNEDDQHREDPS